MNPILHELAVGYAVANDAAVKLQAQLDAASARMADLERQLAEAQKDDAPEASPT